MELKLKLDPAYMPVAVAFAESAARAAAFGERECTLLALSVEEVFMSLCDGMPGLETELSFRNRRFAADICFRFAQPPPDLRVFNITSSPDHESEQGLASMGLFLASRACDQFAVNRLPGGTWEVLLRKDRDYPVVALGATFQLASDTLWNICADPTPQVLKELSGLFGDCFPASCFLDELTPPGRLIDKAASGDYGMVAAVTHNGSVAGGMVWRIGASRAVTCFGPCMRPGMESPGLVAALCEAATEKLARGKWRGMVLYAPEEPPQAAGFEPLGLLPTPNGTLWIGYRMMDEDFGAMSMVPEELAPFVRDSCTRLALPRDIRICTDNGECGDGLTLFATRVNRATATAVMLPMLVGRDASQVIAEHLTLLEREGIGDIYCHLDTGRYFNALLTRHFLDQGFAPRILIPYGGTGDLIHLHRSRSVQ